MTSYRPRAGVDAKTRDGERAIIEMTEGDGKYPVRGRVGGSRFLECWMHDGGFVPDGTTKFDLVSDWRVEAGKTYRARNGETFGPLQHWPGDRFIVKQGDGYVWDYDGKNQRDGSTCQRNPDLDFVAVEPAETAPEPVAPSPSTEQIAKAWLAGMAPTPEPEPYSRADVEALVEYADGLAGELIDIGFGDAGATLRRLAAPFLPKPPTCPTCGKPE